MSLSDTLYDSGGDESGGEPKAASRWVEGRADGRADAQMDAQMGAQMGANYHRRMRLHQPPKVPYAFASARAWLESDQVVICVANLPSVR